MSNSLTLASASPRRAELLRQIGVQFEVCVAAVDETVVPGEDPAHYVERIARAKAAAVQASVAETGAVDVAAAESRIILAADTAVVVDGDVLGKPASKEDGISMLMRLSGRDHQVLTAVAVTDGRETLTEVVTTIVTFVGFDERVAETYWATGEGADKAGCYGIQGIGGIFAESIKGSYSAVVGLPLSAAERLLTHFKVETLTRRAAS